MVTPNFFFSISITLVKIYISCIIINRGKNTFELVGTVLNCHSGRNINKHSKSHFYTSRVFVCEIGQKKVWYNRKAMERAANGCRFSCKEEWDTNQPRGNRAVALKSNSKKEIVVTSLFTFFSFRPDSHGTGRIFYGLKFVQIGLFTRNHAKRTKI